MKFFVSKFILLLFVFLPGIVLAEIEWVFAGDNKNVETYVDLTSIKRDDDLVIMRELTRFKEKKTTSNGLGYQTVISYSIYDCLQSKYNVLSMSFFDDKWGLGDAVLEYTLGKNWIDLKSDSIASGFMSIACDGKSYKVS